jgi:hypothetical protein
VAACPPHGLAPLCLQASSLVLAALRPGQLLQDMADAAAKGSHQLAHPCTL